MSNTTPSTDPAWFTTTAAVEAATIEVLTEVRAKAEKTFATCGGHKMAARMQMVITMIDVELAAREIDEIDFSCPTCGLADAVDCGSDCGL